LYYRHCVSAFFRGGICILSIIHQLSSIPKFLLRISRILRVNFLLKLPSFLTFSIIKCLRSRKIIRVHLCESAITPAAFKL
jgi:hypothetical protein